MADSRERTGAREFRFEPAREFARGGSVIACCERALVGYLIGVLHRPARVAIANAFNFARPLADRRAAGDDVEKCEA